LILINTITNIRGYLPMKKVDIIKTKSWDPIKDGDRREHPMSQACTSNFERLVQEDVILDNKITKTYRMAALILIFSIAGTLIELIKWLATK